MAESEEELKSLLMKVKQESKKPALKFNIQKTKIMTSSPITPWHTADQTTDSPSPPGSSASQAPGCLHLAFKSLPPLACIPSATSRLIIITLTLTWNSLCKNAFLTSFFPSAHHPAPTLPCWNLSCYDLHPPTPINIQS